MKAIFFNAKGILYQRPDPHQHLQAFLEKYNLQLPAEDRFKKALADLKNQILRGRLRQDVYQDAVLKMCGVTNVFLFEEGRAALQQDHVNISLLPGVIPTLEQLKIRGFKLGIITDSYASQEEKTGWMRERGLQIEWDAYANSKDLEALKPDLSLYHAAMQQAKVSASECTFVGVKAIELLTAKSLGMTTIAFQSTADFQADYTLNMFEDLLSVPILRLVH
jgi:HAD superfamily hydrolase (TIGR01509 family)